MTRWKDTFRSSAEVTAVHEGWPGHHLQASTALSAPSHAISKVALNSAYTEGWGRYAEALAEEFGIYQSPLTPIRRRLWTGQGLMVDAGIHALGWSREQAVSFLMGTGSTKAAAEGSVDRVAAFPGQWTAYDTGLIEILALRREAEQALGSKFDLKSFHQAFLGNGIVPLDLLARNVRSWIASQR